MHLAIDRAVDLIGACQGGGFFALCSWAQKDGPLLQRFLASHFKQPTALAMRICDEALLRPPFGIVPDVRLDMDGLRTVLGLRAALQGQ